MSANHISTSPFINSLPELQSNTERIQNNERYAKLCRQICTDFGLNHAWILQHFDQGVKVVLGEQHGGRVKPSYKARIALLHKIIRELEGDVTLDSVNSGVKWLLFDTFTATGWKYEQNALELGIPGIGNYKIIPDKTAASYTWYPYAVLPSPETDMYKVLGQLQLLTNEVKSILKKLLFPSSHCHVKVAEVFRSHLGELKTSGWAPALNFTDGKVTPLGLHHLLTKLEGNTIPQQLYTSHLEGTGWNNRAEYRRLFNQSLFDVPIGDSDHLFNSMILLIEDPHRFCNAIIQTQLSSAGESVSSHHDLAKEGILKFTNVPLELLVQESLPNHKNKMIPIYYNIHTQQFHYQIPQKDTQNGSPTLLLKREDIQKFAQTGKTSWPCAIGEYLMLFLMWYLLIDDGHDTDFTTKVRGLIGTYADRLQFTLKLPLITMNTQLATRLAQVGPEYWDDFLSLWSPNVQPAILQAVEDF